MSVNGVTGNTQVYSNYEVPAANSTDTAKEAEKTTTTAKTSEKAAETAESKKDGVVYDKSDAKKTTSTKDAKSNAAIIAKLKADSEARTKQMQSLVEQLIGKQGKAYGQANDNMWRFLASGDYTVDPATKAQAQADIAEDGYWGVKQTSDRILDFAKALSNGDPNKMNDMLEAFKKGFKQATKTWGQELPEISQKTYDAVLEKFDAWQKENNPQKVAENGMA